jgi:hypothetical protein
MPQTSPAAGRRWRGAAAVLLSLAAHAALVLALAAFPARPARRGLAVESTVVQGCTLSLAPLPGPHPRPGHLDGGVRLLDPPEYEVAVTVTPPPAPLPAPAPPSATGTKGPPAEAVRSDAQPPRAAAAGSGGAPGAGSGAGPSGAGGLFAVPPGTQRVVYVIDHSVSMGLHGSLRRALHELLDSLRRLPDGTQFQVVLYNQRPEILYIHHSFYLAALDAAAREEVARAVANLTATGSSNHRGALEQALKFQPDVLYLVTDGAELSEAEVLALTRLNQRPTAIHAVELTRRGRPADSPLYRLARLNRGTYRVLAPEE